MPPDGRGACVGARGGAGGARSLAVALAVAVLLLAAPAAGLLDGATPPLPTYPCGHTALPSPAGFQAVYVNPRYKGTSTGSHAQPYTTLQRAWADVPKGTPLTQGIVVYFYPGISGSGANSLWMDEAFGTEAAPIIFTRAPDAPAGDVDLQSINVHNCSHLFFQGVVFKQAAGAGGGSFLHFASCRFIHLLGIRATCRPGLRAPQEALKVNQVQGMYVEDSVITQANSRSGANTLDYVAVQYGHICRNQFSGSTWGVYVKGGSSYLVIDSNVVANTYESGLRVGQGTGFEFMQAPWLTYETFGVRVTNNVIYNVYGAGLGVAGGYDILIAYNSVYLAGQRSHMAEFVYGGRGCDGDADLAGMCKANQDAGGWGPDSQGGTPWSIPSKNVYFLNNLLVNPASKPSKWNHFFAQLDPDGGALPPPNGTSTADNLIIAGNVIVNKGARTIPGLGLDACTDTNPTCNTTGVLATNNINTPGLAVTFLSTATLALNPASKAAIRGVWKRAALPDFPPWSTPPVLTPAGALTTGVAVDKAGASRLGDGVDLPGALV